MCFGAWLASGALAQEGFAGTKASPVASGGSGGVGIMPIFQMLLALGIVLALLRFALPKLMGKLNRTLVPGVGSSIRVEESANFAGGSLYIVNVKHKSLLLSVSSSGVQYLTDLTDPVGAAPQEPAPPTFKEMVQAEMQDAPKPAGEDELKKKLERLDRLGGLE